MFQFAALLGIALRRGYEYCIPPSDAGDLRKEHQLFQAFLLPSLRVVGWQKGAARARARSFAYDAELALSCADNVDLFGHFQSEKYFEDAKDQVRRDLQFKPEIDDFCASRISGLGKVPISLHVRRGDYVGSSTHPTCLLDYYEAALKEVPRDLPIILFSDDIDWCRKQPLFQGPRWVYSGKVPNVVDLCLMSHCAHHIIANSSFSWWGAWLGRNPDKIVVAPSRWFAETGRMSSHDTSDLIPEGWIRI